MIADLELIFTFVFYFSMLYVMIVSMAEHISWQSETKIYWEYDDDRLYALFHKSVDDWKEVVYSQNMFMESRK